MKFLSGLALLTLSVAPAFAAVEEAIDSRFKPATPDAAVGDWQGSAGSHYVAQVVLDEHGDYQANLLKAFDTTDNFVATLRGQNHDGHITLKGGGWSGAIEGGHFKGAKDSESFDLQAVTRTSPTLGAKPPAGAVVLFDGKSLDAWANKKGKEWLVEDGPAPWKIVDGALEVVPGTGGGIISHQKFGDCRVHVEFRTLGAPSNSGVFLQTRYEANINETYGKLDGTPNGGFDNCTPKGSEPKIRATRPPLVWQTFDIEFTAPRFDAAGNKTANASASVLLNGVKIYDHQSLELPHGAAGRLGEAATGPMMLQEHGMPLQFRNIWVAPLTP
jgi:hypothetical protein